jgi:site-specific DNA-methyltransferase (adenine-specific)
VPLYGRLSELTATALKPGGVLAVMCGQYHLPDVLAAMTPHLAYCWTMAYLMFGDTNQVWNRKVNTSWKPVLVFGRLPKWCDDVVRSGGPDKEHHEWGQDEVGMAALVDKLTRPGQLVCDPFLGGGTTAGVLVAADEAAG